MLILNALQLKSSRPSHFSRILIPRSCNPKNKCFWTSFFSELLNWIADKIEQDHRLLGGKFNQRFYGVYEWPFLFYKLHQVRMPTYQMISCQHVDPKQEISPLPWFNLASIKTVATTEWLIYNWIWINKKLTLTANTMQVKFFITGIISSGTLLTAWTKNKRACKLI